MKKRVVVVGAGMGGLTASCKLADHGFEVTLLEAREKAGGLASGFTLEGFPFDTGPYVLLDRPGLEWAFKQVGLDLQKTVPMKRIEDVYEVRFDPNQPVVRIHGDMEKTAAGFDKIWPQSGWRYVDFVRKVTAIYERLQPMLFQGTPGPLDLFKTGGWRHAPFLLSSLATVLARAKLPGPVVEALGIWTHVAGQTMAAAPSPLAFVPALIHSAGAWYPSGGVGAVPAALIRAAAARGVDIRYGMKAKGIKVENGRVTGVVTQGDKVIQADAVLSNYNGVGTYLELAKDATPEPNRRALAALPLQSPGVAAYLAVRGSMDGPYLRFYLPADRWGARLLVRPGVMDPSIEQPGGWWPARLIKPMSHEKAELDGEPGQRALLKQTLAEGWWREDFSEQRVMGTKIPSEWGVQYHLHRDSMNPVMTAAFMRAGRIPHRSKTLPGLYLAGSSTHPGQWVSFCAISGVLAATQLHQDLNPRSA